MSGQGMNGTLKRGLSSVRVDGALLGAVLGLIVLGLVMVLSSSAIAAERIYDNMWHLFGRQAVFAVLGMGALCLGTVVNPRFLQRHAYAILGVGFFLLVAVLIPGVGRTVGGATRWLQLGPLRFQAGELAKVVVVVYLAASIAKKGERMRVFAIGVVPHVVVVGMAMLLLMMEPDFGTCVLLAVVTLMMLFVGGARLWTLGLGFALILPLGVLAIVSKTYRVNRIIAFLEPWAHRDGVGYQVVQSLMTFGSGGATGQGLGAGRQKLFYLPEAHTDFILAVVGEEMGFIGVVLVVAGFATLAARGLKAAASHADNFSAFLALGLTTLMLVQAMFNAAVVIGLVPTKGITLPFLSYGGSSLLMSCYVAGVLVRLAGEAEAQTSEVNP